MLNPFTTIPAFLKVMGELKTFNRIKPTIDRLHEDGKYEEERALILQGTSVFADRISEKLDMSVTIYGEENTPNQGPVFIVANHQSYADIYALFYTIRKFQIGFIAKSEFESFKTLAEAIRNTRSVFIVRGDAREAIELMKTTTEMMKSGFSLAIFPEGTRSRGGKMAEFKPGSFKFAQKAGVPILPVSLEGGYHLFEEKNSYQRGTRIKVKVHPLVHYEQMDRKQQNAANKEIEETIRQGVKELQEMD
ncbi:MAG: 1-acyl-sn-glycerol-3-phosphate acyltransferase [Mogibacterium sp.]|nr:1-acyl-sn-glycerol-3-phosphate acyltransferase [Mogibacterium sp.]